MRKNVENYYERYYFEEYLKETRGYSEKTLRTKRNAIAYLNDFLSGKLYKNISKEDLIGFKEYMRNFRTKNNGRPSVSLLTQTLKGVEDFLNWLRDEKGYKKFTSTFISYVSPTRTERALASAPKIQIPPTLDQIEKMIISIPETTDMNKRNRGILAFFALTGGRQKAIRTLQVKHFDPENKCIFWDTKSGVEMKHNSGGLTAFLPISKKLEEIFMNYYKHITIKHKFTPDMPLFPRMKMRQKQSDTLFETNGYSTEFIQSGDVLPSILREACKNAGIKYINPHSLRHFASTHIFTNHEIMRLIGAVRQNFTHLDIETTYGYANINSADQIKIIRGMKLK